MPCLSSSVFSDLNESIRVSNAVSQLALPLAITTFLPSRLISSPKGSAVWTGAVAEGAGAWGAAGGVAGGGVGPGAGAGGGGGWGGGRGGRGGRRGARCGRGRGGSRRRGRCRRRLRQRRHQPKRNRT